MLPYLFTFAISCVLFALSQRVSGEQYGKYLPCVLFILALLPPCVLAGARDLGVGTDTQGYGIWLYEAALSTANFSSYMTQVDRSIWDVESLYAFCSFVVARTTGSTFAYFFAIELAALLPIALVAKTCSDKHAWLIMLLYYMFLYIPSLNMMRQSVALGLVLLSITSNIKGSKLTSAVIMIVAFSIHTSALVGLLFLLLWVSLCRETDEGFVFRKQSRYVIIAYVAVVFFGTVLFRELCEVLVGIPQLKHLALYAVHDGDPIGLSETFFSALLVLGMLLMLRCFDAADRCLATFLCLVVSTKLSFLALSGIDVTIARMGEYCLVFVLPYVACCLKQPSIRTVYPLLGISAVGFSALFRFFWCFVLRGFNEAVPYASSLLGF